MGKFDITVYDLQSNSNDSSALVLVDLKKLNQLIKDGKNLEEFKHNVKRQRELNWWRYEIGLNDEQNDELEKLEDEISKVDFEK